MAATQALSTRPTRDTGFILLVTCAAAIGGFLFGYDSAVVNGTVNGLEYSFHTQPGELDFPIASLLLGCVFGSAWAGPLADRFGRKPVMVGTGLVFLVSSLGSGAVSTPLGFVVNRIAGGIAVGAASVIAPAYISEISPADLRGRLASLQQMGIVIGIFAAQLVNWLIARAAGSATAPFWSGLLAWRWMFFVEVIPSFAYVLAGWLVPESPRWLIARGRNDEAAAVLRRTEGGAVDEHVRVIADTVRSERRPRLSDLLQNGRVLPIVWVGIVLSCLQQFVGINVVFYYGAVLWQAAGFAENDALRINVISGVVNVLSTVVAIATIDRFGRKPLLLLGSIGMALTLGTMAMIFMGASVDTSGKLALSGASGLSALVAANAYVFAFGISWGPVVWVLLGEMFNNRIRGSALSVGASAQWIANFVVTLTFPILLRRLGLGAAYGIYAAFAAFSAFFVWRAITETRGRTLEQM